MTCDGCKYWSELIAEWMGGGPLQATCLNKQSPKYGMMVHRGCEHYSAGRAIDDPCPVASEIGSEDWHEPTH